VLRALIQLDWCGIVNKPLDFFNFLIKVDLIVYGHCHINPVVLEWDGSMGVEYIALLHTNIPLLSHYVDKAEYNSD
jgi:hypothetical protein